MKPITTIVFCLSMYTAFSQEGQTSEGSFSHSLVIKDNKRPRSQGKQLNFFIISKPKKLFDPASRFNIIRSRIKSVLRPNRFVCIVASSSGQMSAKVQKHLKKHNATIGSIWFDSHGSYKKGYSFFTIGTDEISFKNIADSTVTLTLKNLGEYSTPATKIGIGSCYGAATFLKPSSGNFAGSPMHGDSLLRSLSRLFPGSTVFGCESWVMTKPGLFKERFAMAGFPLRKKFKDVVYKPVWDRVGMWNSYNEETGTITPVNCVILNKYGDIKIRFNNYQSLRKIKKRIASNKKKLRPNLMKT